MNSSMNVNILILIKEVSIYNLIKILDLGSLAFKGIRHNFMVIRVRLLFMAIFGCFGPPLLFDFMGFWLLL